MKILIVSRRYYPEVIGGGQISAHHIAQALVKAKHDVRVLTFSTSEKRTDVTLDNVRITKLPIRVLKYFPRFSNLEWMYREMKLQTLNFLKEFRPDVIHALNGESVPSIAAVSRTTGIPFVATINGPNLFCFTMQGNDSRGENCFGCHGWQRFRETMLMWGKGSPLNKVQAFVYWMYSYLHMHVFTKAARQANLLLPVSKDIQQRLQALGYNRLRIVHNPIDVHERSSAQKITAQKEELGIPKGDKLLLFVGRITESKGVQRIINVLSNLKKTHLVIVGRGDHVDALKALAQERKVSDRVHFTGFVENDKVGEFYSIADIVLMVGSFYESLGRMLLEACSYGVPIIATNSGGNPDIIEHGKNGFLVSLTDDNELTTKISEILDNTRLAHTMGVACKTKILREFSPPQIANNLTSCYIEILDHKRA